MPEKGQIYVPLDFRGHSEKKLPFILELDEEGDQPCIRLGIFTKTVHIEMRADSPLVERFIFELVGANRDLREKLAFLKGALHAAKKKKR